MSAVNKSILVFGATGQQGGSVVRALIAEGWPVSAIVRNAASPNADSLRDAGVVIHQGSYSDADAIRAAMTGAYGVFSVQQSSPSGQVSDDEEVAAGFAIADLAVEAGVSHLVYSSGAAVGDSPTGMAHFDTKMRIEQHLWTLPIAVTVIRPVSFLEMLMMPGFGLDEGRFTFFMPPEQKMQFIAVDDIGKFVEPIFADRDRYAGKTLQIASDEVSGQELAHLLSQAAGRPISYSRFSDDVLAASPFLAKLTALYDEGALSGDADLRALRAINPNMQSVRKWLAGAGRDPLARALGTAGSWDYDRS